MKKFITLSIALLLIFSLTACNLISLDIGDGSDFKYNSEYVKENLTGDYSITYKSVTYGNGQIESTNYFKVISTDEGVYTEITDEDGYKSGYLFVRNGDNYILCEGSPEDGFTKPESLEYAYQVTKEQAEAYGGMGLNYFINYYSDMASLMKSDGTETIAGRKCDKFKAGITILGAGVQNFYSVDQQTGICMKFALAASAQGESGGMEFECVEFLTSGVQLPAYN